jgi:hypothetical protein
MTLQEITDYVNGLSTSDVRRLSATDVMGWELFGADHPNPYYYNVRTREFMPYVKLWRPDEDRNQSRLVTDKVREYTPISDLYQGLVNVTENDFMTVFDITPDEETRAALIAHYVRMEDMKNETR